MTRSDYVISVTEANFEYEVIAFSRQTPVIADFWAEWCVPCKTLGPQLERLAAEAQGAFRLAKIDVDANPNLALRFGVRSIPAVKAFRDEQVIAEFVGVQPEPRLREFLRSIVPSPSDLLLEKALSLLEAQQWASAERAFRQFLDKAPDYPVACLGLARSLLPQGRVLEAQDALRDLPASKELATAETMQPLIEAMLYSQNKTLLTDDPLDAAYQRALHLIARGNLEAAMDGLLDVLRQDKRYRRGELRKVMLGLFEVLGENNPLTRQYRSELSSVLF